MFFGFFGKNRLFEGWNQVQTFSRSTHATTFILFFISFNSNRIIFYFFGRLWDIFRVHSYSWTTFIFYDFLKFDIWIWLNFGVVFVFLGPEWAGYGVGLGFNNYFWVYSCSWTTFIFYVSFNSFIWFWLNFWIILDFLGPWWAIFGLG